MIRILVSTLPVLLLAPGGLAQEQQADARGEFIELRTEFMRARAAWQQAALRKMREEARKAKQEGRQVTQRSIAMNPKEVVDEFLPRFQQGAEKYKGTEGAIPFLTFLLTADRTKGNATTKQAFKTLLADHVRSEAFADVANLLPAIGGILGDEYVEKAERMIFDKSPHASVKAAAHFSRANATLRNNSASEEEKTQALEAMRKVVELAPDSRYGKQAGGVIFEAEHLAVGKVAPDIVGKDLDGVEFKLSDYRGKVVMLDFWGDW